MTVIERALVLAFCVVYCTGDASIYPYDLTTEYLKNPLAVDVRHPRLSWKLGAEIINGSLPQNLTQTAYQIVAASNTSLLEEEPDLWDSGKVESDKQTNIPYEGKIPGAGKRIYWTVRVWDQLGNDSSYANESSWDVGHSREWTAKWISAPDDLQRQAENDLTLEDRVVVLAHLGLKPVIYLRKEFTIDSNVSVAKVYATAKGLYKISVNEDLDVPILSPGWTDYEQSIQYQVYDVTKLIGTKNVIAVKLGTGWYSGYVGSQGKYGYYGNEESFLMELHIEFENGTKVIVGTDETWKAAAGPIMYSDLLQGELYYENRNIIGWRNYGYNDRQWSNVETSDVYYELLNLIADRGQAVVELEKRPPVSAKQKSPQVWIYDFGLNFAGYVEIELDDFTSEVRVQLRHAEMVNPDGSIYIDNLRTARAIDTYVLNNAKTRETKKVLKPHFTYHGFRYVEVTGFSTQLKTIRGIRIGIKGIDNSITTDNKIVNTLMANVVNSQLSNFISIPTNSPQRDERMGSMADAQLFTPTAIYNGNVAAFMTKWMRDVREAQSKTTGSFSDVSPRLVDLADGSPSWGDAGIIITWHLYRMYGDVRIIEENFEHMQVHLDYILSANPNLLWLNGVNNNYGDKLSIDATPAEVFSTAYFAYDALLLSKMAKVLGKELDFKKYSQLQANISAAFIKEYVSANDGKIRGDTQTAYLLPVAFEILPAESRITAVRNLVANIKKKDGHLSSGMGGAAYLLPVLSKYGYDDIAYELLLQTTNPSWGYMTENGATSLWEVWNPLNNIFGVKYPGSFSYNNYALGTVGEWIYKYMAGIDTDDTEVGFKKIIIKPHIDQGVDHMVAWYDSPQGPIGVEWQKTSRSVDLFVTIPVNANAQITFTYLGKTLIRYVPSGQYNFTIPLTVE